MYVLNRIPNVSTKFGDDWSNSKEMAKVLEIRDGGDRACQVWLKIIHWFFEAERWKIAFSL